MKSQDLMSRSKLFKENTMQTLKFRAYDDLTDIYKTILKYDNNGLIKYSDVENALKEMGLETDKGF